MELAWLPQAGPSGRTKTRSFLFTSIGDYVMHSLFLMNFKLVHSGLESIGPIRKIN